MQGKVALCACNHRFLSVTEDGCLVAASEKAEKREVMTVSGGVLCGDCAQLLSLLPDMADVERCSRSKENEDSCRGGRGVGW